MVDRAQDSTDRQKTQPASANVAQPDKSKRLAEALEAMAYLDSDEIGIVSDYLAADGFGRREDILREYKDWIDQELVTQYLASLASKEEKR